MPSCGDSCPSLRAVHVVPESVLGTFPGIFPDRYEVKHVALLNMLASLALATFRIAGQDKVDLVEDVAVAKDLEIRQSLDFANHDAGFEGKGNLQHECA